MLELLTDDLLVAVCCLVQVKTIDLGMHLRYLLPLVAIRGVSRGLRATVRRLVTDVDLLKLADAMDASRSKMRTSLISYCGTLRLRCALPSLWDGKHPASMVKCVAECPCAAKNALTLHINTLLMTRQYELLGRYTAASMKLVCAGLALAFSWTSHNRGAQLNLLEYMEPWLGAKERCTLLDAVSDHEHLLRRVSEALRVKTPLPMGRPLAPLSFSSHTARKRSRLLAKEVARDPHNLNDAQPFTQL